MKAMQTWSTSSPFMRRAAALCIAGALALPMRAVTAQATGGEGVSAGLAREVTRARALIEQGDGADARTVLDSLVQAAPLASLDLAEALYWRAVLAERISDAERDWKRLVIEAPLSPRTPDALLRLGELDMLRGRPADARPYFERVVREFPDSTRIARGTIWLVRSYFDESELPRGCQTLRALPVGNVPEGELRLQADELRRRCTSVVTDAATTAAPKNTAVAPATRPAPAAPVESTTTTAAAEPEKPTAGSGRFSVQLAAFDTRKEAETSVARLKRAGVEARIDGSRKPFRVRTGRYATRAEATAALAKLKKQGQGGFVAEISP
ncbi:MAG TPA: SPOR domain-containing protein [Gemmatimonas sp.]|uniref:SPOR domain-containing protein n=1 Tax=Gemmatimonas sp. TaxID=1962908 RepID=UPI002EDB7875